MLKIIVMPFDKASFAKSSDLGMAWDLIEGIDSTLRGNGVEPLIWELLEIRGNPTFTAYIAPDAMAAFKRMLPQMQHLFMHTDTTTTYY